MSNDANKYFGTDVPVATEVEEFAESLGKELGSFGLTYKLKSDHGEGQLELSVFPHEQQGSNRHSLSIVFNNAAAEYPGVIKTSVVKYGTSEDQRQERDQSSAKVSKEMLESEELQWGDRSEKLYDKVLSWAARFGGKPVVDKIWPEREHATAPSIKDRAAGGPAP